MTGDNLHVFRHITFHKAIPANVFTKAESEAGQTNLPIKHLKQDMKISDQA